MNVDAILVSDFAESIGDKLVIVGTFNRIGAKKFPAVHPVLAVSLIIHGHADEAGRSFDLEIQLIDQDRKPVLPAVHAKGMFPDEVPPWGTPLRVQLAYRVIGAKFEREGPYAFEVYIDGTYHASASFYVAKAADASADA